MEDTDLSNPLPGVPLVESPFFPRMVDSMGLSDVERDIAERLHRDGYATFDFPDADIAERIDRIIGRLTPLFGTDLTDRAGGMGSANLRMQDEWQHDEDVRAIACNDAVVALLSKLYGRPAFPFQTLNFPVATQQSTHSDSIHFSSLPERFMCGVWLAFEDISADAGPLLYYPGSHQWPIASNAMLGLRGGDNDRSSAQTRFEPYWQKMIDVKQCAPATFLARKGQGLIWAANLLHGGSPQANPALTRWSQVTHYYFKDCIYYTPAFSDEAVGRLDLRCITNIATGTIEPNRHFGTIVEPPVPGDAEGKGGWRARRQLRRMVRLGLPDDFDPKLYYRLNPDVALAGHDAARHFMMHGQSEGRRYKV